MALSDAATLILRWRADPIAFVRECLHAEPDLWQAQALTAYADDSIRRIAIKACKGPGKTCVLAWMILHFLLTRGDGRAHPKAIATSISADNLRDNLWAELARWINASDLLKALFRWSAERVFAISAPADHFVAARAWCKSADPQQQALTLAGLHAPWVLYVLDESGGIPDSVMVSAEGALSTAGTWGKIVQAGNPTHLSGPLYRACTSARDLWHVITITGDPDAADRSPRISEQSAREQIQQYGRDNPWVRVNVFGEFPPASIDALLGPEEIAAAMRRNPLAEVHGHAQRRLGVDVARFGDDATVIIQRQGLAAFQPVEMRGARTTDIAARVMKIAAEWRPELILIDDTGHWGHGVIDNLIAAGYAPQGVQFHGPAIDPRYRNRRAEMWLEMSEWVKRGGCLPNLPILAADLSAPTYAYVNGKFQLEDKDHIKARLGRSPDYGDALALTFALPEMPAEMRVGGRIMAPAAAHQTVHEFDPFRDGD